MTIFFYKVDAAYGCFSNFSPHPVHLHGHTWSTSEHYYQAQKFVGSPHSHLCEKIRQAATPEQAAQIGRNPAWTVRSDWDAVKDKVMWEVVLTKFATNPDIQQVLLATGDQEIVEDSPTDAYWGCGADGRGQNRLGKILMQVRETLRR